MLQVLLLLLQVLLLELETVDSVGERGQGGQRRGGVLHLLQPVREQGLVPLHLGLELSSIRLFVVVCRHQYTEHPMGACALRLYEIRLNAHLAHSSHGPLDVPPQVSVAGVQLLPCEKLNPRPNNNVSN